ncbi:hypothetical protein C8K30_105185 [Promicromonospora sp. AC04]|uniref:hypothetical protein n=1 Tax=Promicromonospora sp. AC04 TaxID=2135723 RepID=UPI000D4E1AD7|nr:hypothetical protein [Promicromonospora sp. AC04]PUB26957.1 hypothetical protein C8K30_105185 [Promicromonospora sp. AC04]
MSRLRGTRLRGARLLAGAALTVLLAAGCGGGGGGGGGYGGGGDDGGDAGAGGMTLEITSPTDGSTVEVPFTVDLTSSEELGPTESGAHHVHVFFDGDDEEYMVVEGESAEVTDLPEGEHVINASLRNADHSPAGVETEVTVTVGAGGAGSDTGGDTDDGY